jgi:hypothetical protein
MFCSQCGSQLEQSAVYCEKCGKPVASFNFSDRIPDVEPLEEETKVRPSNYPVKKSYKKPAALGGLMLLIGLILGGLVVGGSVIAFLAYNQNQRADNSATVNANHRTPVLAQTPNLPPATTPVAIPTVEEKPKTQIANQQFPVQAGHFVWYQFNVASSAQVTGGFVAYGGNNDIDAFIVDDRSFELVSNGLNANTFYHSGYTTKGKINITVPAGKYYLIFDNRKAWITPKSVAAEVYFQEQ